MRTHIITKKGSRTDESKRKRDETKVSKRQMNIKRYMLTCTYQKFNRRINKKCLNLSAQNNIRFVTKQTCAETETIKSLNMHVYRWMRVYAASAYQTHPTNRTGRLAVSSIDRIESNGIKEKLEYPKN